MFMLVTFGPLGYYFSRKPHELDQICLHIAGFKKSLAKIKFEIQIQTCMRWSCHNVDTARVISKSVANQKKKLLQGN